MMRRSILTALALPIGALFVAACSAGNGDGAGPPPPPEPVELEVGSDGAAAHEFTLAAGETEHFTFPTDLLAGEFDDLVVIELEWPAPDAAVRLDLTDAAGGEVIATSIGPDYFWSATGAQPGSAQANHELGSEALRPAPRLCRGPCVVIRPTGEPEFFGVTNTGDSPLELSLFVYTSLYVDTFEPTNDDRATPSGYVIGEIGEGAIETVGDVDWWQVTSLEQTSSTIEFVHTGELELMLYLDTGFATIPYEPGDRVVVEVGDLLRVESVSGLAARGAPGFYYLEPIPAVTPDAGP